MPRARANPGRPVSLESSSPAEAPAVCRAGLFQFAARQTFTNGCVQSRALFWCKSGSGECEVNGVRYRLEPQTLYVLPWGRRITYLPSSRDPMYTAHVHLVPWYRPGARWVANIPHERGEPEFDSPDRADVSWPLPSGVVRFSLRADDRLGRLVDYAVRWYLETDRSETEARHLGSLLVAELLRVAVAETSAGAQPEELRRLVVHIDRGFHLAPSVKELAALVGRSRSHVLKLFRRHLGVSAKHFILQRQLKEARELLLSTTLPVSEVGRQVGQPDPYHFSKLFRRHVGLTPSAYRENHGPFSSPPRPSAHQKVLPATLGR